MLKRCRIIDELKSVSQNVMHSSVRVTDSIYGRLVENEVKKTIEGLGMIPQNDDLSGEVEKILRKLLKENE